MTSLITIVHVVTCILVVIVVLLQSGKGAEISASFGGSSQTVFGSSGGVSFFVKFTGILAAIFMLTSVTLTIMGGENKKSLFESMTPATRTAPAAPAVPATPGKQATAPTAPVTDAAQQPAPATPGHK